MINKIESLVSSLPVEWKDKVTTDFTKMRMESPTRIDPKIEQSRFTISTIIQPELAVREKILQIVAPFVKNHKGIFLQPANGFHFTVQWSDFLNGNFEKLTQSLKDLELPPLELEVKLIYPSKPNLFAVLIPKNDVLWMSKIREKVTGFYNSSSFTPILPEKLPLMWISIARFTKDFDPMTLDQLVNELPEKTIQADKFKLILAKTDPYFTQNTAEIIFSKDF